MRCRSARRNFVPKNTSFTPDEIPPAQTSMSVVQRGATVQQKIPIQPLVLSLCCLRREILTHSEQSEQEPLSKQQLKADVA